MDFKTYFQKEGEGKPLVFLHGLWGGGNYFPYLPLPFCEHYSSYFIDELGFGRSVKPTIDYTFENHCKAIHNSLALSEPAIFVGHSFGAALAVSFANFYPEDVSKLILLSPAFYPTKEEAKRYISNYWLGKLTIENPLLTQVLCKTCCPTGITASICAGFGEIKGIKAIQLFGHTWHSYISTIQNCFLSQPIDMLLSSLKQKDTLMLYGDNDNTISLPFLESLDLPKLIKYVKPNGNHFVVMRDPEWINNAIELFLK